MYTNQLLVSNYLQRTLTENEIAFLVPLITAVQLWIDAKVSSHFDEVSATTRYYDGGTSSIDIDPATAITEVKAVNMDASLSDSYIYTANDEYRLEPFNDTVKREIRRNSGSFPSGSGVIAVTAKFSEYNSGVPQDIQTAATIMCAEVLNQGKIASSGGNVASESLEGHSVSYDTSSSSLDGIAAANPNIKSILDLRRELLVG